VGALQQMVYTNITDIDQLQCMLMNCKNPLTKRSSAVKKIVEGYQGEGCQPVLDFVCTNCVCLQCFDAVGWATGRASSL